MPCLCALAVVLAFVILSAGCTQQPAGSGTAGSTVPMSPTTARTPVVTAAQTGDRTIVVTYLGGPDLEDLMELEVTVTDSQGISKTQSMGSRQTTTPVQKMGTSTFTGDYRGKDHVVIVGYHANGSMQNLLDTTL